MPERLPPYRTFLASDSEIRELLREFRTIAMVGLPGSPESIEVRRAQELKQRGYRVVPVECDAPEILGMRPFATLEEVDGQVEIVNLLPDCIDPHGVARQAVAGQARVLWIDPGMDLAELAYRVSKKGLLVVLGRDLLGEYSMHFPDDEMGFPPAQDAQSG